MKFKHLIIIALIALTSCKGSNNDSTKVVAHRGFWLNQGITENTIESLYNANKLGCHATEFDVRLTKDNVLVLSHDDKVQDIKISESKSTVVKEIVLENGEHIPTLDEYLDKAKDMDINLILELKEMSSFNQETQAIQKINKAIKERGLSDRVSFISFSISTCKNFIKQIPGSKVYYLCSSSAKDKFITPEQAKSVGLTGVDYYEKIFRDNPQLIKDFQNAGLEVNVWTVNKEEDMRFFIEQGVDYITTDKPDVAMKLISQ